MTVSLDELVKKARDVAIAASKVAGDVVGEVVDTSKAKLSEVKISSEIREITERLGSIVYEAAKTGRDSIKLQEMLIAELDNLYKNLEELRKNTTVGSTQVEVICPTCGEKNAASAVFCGKCGTKLIVEQAHDYAVDVEVGDTADVQDEATAEASQPEENKE